MDAEKGRIPQILLDFLKSPGGHSLVLKGEAGTGKTTLALQMIEEMGDIQSEYYLSTRVSDEALYQQFPWVEERARRDNVLKASKAFLKKSKSGEEEQPQGKASLTVAKDLLKAMSSGDIPPMIVRSELHKLEGQVESGELGGEEESRFIGEITEESVVLDLGILLPELEVAYDIAEASLPKKTLIVIDSIDALSERYGIAANRLINTLQKDLIEGSGMNVIYTLETSGKSSLDYLGDGVIVLTSEERNGRRVRQLFIEKLRGQKVDHWKYMFTLNGGRITVFRPTWVRIPEKMSKHTAVKDPSANVVSTGNASIDQNISGFPKGALTLLELDIDIHQDVVRSLGLGILSNFLSKNRGVVWLPSYATDYNLIDSQLKMLTGSDAAQKNLRILDASKSQDNNPPFVMTIEGSNAAQDLRWASLRYMLEGSTTPYISILGYDSLEAIYGPGVFKDTLTHIDSMRRNGNVVLAIASNISQSLSQLREQSKVHVKIENINGRVMAVGQKPYTPYYYMDFAEDGKLPLARLFPLV